MGKEFEKGRGFTDHFPLHWPASIVPRPIYARELGMPPITMPPTLTVGNHLSGLSPPNPPLLLPTWQRRLNCCRQVGHPSPPPRREDDCVRDCHLESSGRLWCTIASHHQLGCHTRTSMTNPRASCSVGRADTAESAPSSPCIALPMRA
jgi:hypothetical protein